MKSLTSSIPPHLHELQYSIRFFWRLFQVFQEEKNLELINRLKEFGLQFEVTENLETTDLLNNQTFVIVTHDRQHFGNVDKVITIKDGKAFQGEEPSTMEITA